MNDASNLTPLEFINYLSKKTGWKSGESFRRSCKTYLNANQPPIKTPETPHTPENPPNLRDILPKKVVDFIDKAVENPTVTLKETIDYFNKLKNKK